MSVHSDRRATALVLSCEHARNTIPTRYRAELRCSAATLRSHLAFDPGALEIARHLSHGLNAPLIEGRTTRLLVDLNRPEHAALARARVPAALHERLLREIHRPHWQRVRDAIAAAPAGELVHLGCHSFTPRLRGTVRAFDLGLLYDPARPRERHFAGRWLAALRAELPELRIRRNAPYRGNAPGMTTSLRAELPASRYLGLELECNQRLWRRGGSGWRTLLAGLERSLARALR